MANETLGASFSIDITELKAGLAQANRLIRESESEFREAAAGMDDWTESQEGLEARQKSLNKQIDIQAEKVSALTAEKKRIISEMEKEGKSAEEIARATDAVNKSITQESKQLDKLKGELKKTEKAMDNLSKETEDTEKKTKDMGDAADNAGGKLGGLKAAAGVAVKAVAAVGAACVAAVGAFFGLAEATRESRNDMAKLETSFQTAGLSAENAEKTFTDLYGILGDEGAAVEAAQQLAKISKDEKDLAANTRILTGVMAEYGNSIPLEGLAEGIAASSAMSSVQGVLADALEWQGVNLDDFNAKLAALSTEEERSALIQETLTGLYGESADAYAKNNAQIIAANEAQAKLNDSLNELGAIAEPIMTTLKNLAADLLTTITPFVSLMGEGLAGALNGTEGAADSMAEGLSGILNAAVEKISEMLPFVVDTIIAIVPKLLDTLMTQAPVILESLLGMVEQVVNELLPVLLEKLPLFITTLMTMVSMVSTKLGEMLPTLIPLIIDTVIMLAETLLDNIDMLIDAGISLLMGLADGLIAALPRLIEKIPVIIDKLISAITRNLPKILQMGIDLTLKLASGLIKAVPQLVSKIPQIIKSITGGLKDGISKVKDIGKDLIKGLWNGISDMVGWLGEKIKGFGKGVMDGLKSFFKIKSPSRLMADVVGKNLALGIGKGFTDNIGEVNKDIQSAFNIKPVPVQFSANGVAGGLASGSPGGVVVNQYNTYSQAHSRFEIWQSQENTAAAVKLALMGG